MTKTKKGFLKAGAIIAIVVAALTAIFGLIFFLGQSIVTRDFMVQSYFDCNEGEYVTIENFDGSYTYKYTSIDGEVEELSSEDVDSLIKITKAIMVSVGLFCIGLSIATFVMSILILNNANVDKCKNGQIITLLVLSVLLGNLLSTAFMIVALCLKNKPKEEDTITIEA